MHDKAPHGSGAPRGSKVRAHDKAPHDRRAHGSGVQEHGTQAHGSGAQEHGKALAHGSGVQERGSFHMKTWTSLMTWKTC